ncbi:radical SAM protein [Methanobacterium sp.]|uniref:B12-binding domain-containing radical SAM protein n=1 Tax=Methanobacterium sp. TaxID=2164 RepID=UPI0025D8AF44|nr:radical SAM protein [Methanobacterium sp.]MBI5460515.1 B12-binding domain-containing radical SAM protein [Methanobacterium sp.]
MNEKRKGKVLLVGAEDEENLAIRYLGAELQKKEHTIKIAPCSNNNDFSGVLKELKSFHPDMVAVSMAFQSLAPMFLELIHKIKETNPKVHVTVGGHFPTFEFEEILKDETINSVIRFEGEIPISKLIDALANDKNLSKIPNLVYKFTEGNPIIKENTIIAEFPDLDNLPFPLRNKKPHTRLGERFATLITSRGCFHSRCIYCCIGAFHKQKTGLPYSLRSPENVAREMGELYHHHKVRLFQFHDDNFLLPTKKSSHTRLNSLKKSLLREGVELEDIALLIKTRPDGVDQEILTLLEEMGTVGVFLGVENASDSGLRALARSSTADEINHSLKLLEDFNMGVTFNLLMFHPRATLDEINENIYFMNKNKNLAFDFGRAEIVAGSPLERMVKRKGLLRGQWPHWDYRVQDDAVEKMFRLNTLTFYQENSPYPELSHKLIALSYRSNLLQHFYPGKKSAKLQDETLNLIMDTNEFTLQSLLGIYSLVAERIIEDDINNLSQEMNVFYENYAKKASELAEKMGRFQLLEKKFQERGLGDYFQNSPTLGRIFRI